MSPTRERRSRLFATVVAASASGASSNARDGGIAVGLFLMPLVVIATIGIAMQGYSDPVFSVGFLDAGGSPHAAALRAALLDEPTVRIRSYDDPSRMEAAVYRGRLHAGLQIPADWDGQSDLTIHATAAGVGAIVVRAIAEARLARAVAPGATRDVPSRVHDGGHEGSPPIGFDYTAPSNLVLFLMVSGLISSSGVLLMRQRGITRRLLATPARTGELVLLVLVGPAQMMAVQAVFLVVSTALLVGIRAAILAAAVEFVGQRESTTLGLVFALMDGVGALGALLAGLVGSVSLHYVFPLAGALAICALAVATQMRFLASGSAAHPGAAAQ